MLNIEDDSPQGFGIFPNLTGLIDMMSIIAVLFILISSILLIDFSREKLEALEKAEEQVNIEKKYEEAQTQLDSYKEHIVTIERENEEVKKNYFFLKEEYASLFNELEKYKTTKIIIPNEMKGKVFFDSGKAKIKSQFYPILNNFYLEIRNSLNNEGFNLVQVEGYTDDVPIRSRSKYKDNWDLGAARAIAVVRYLESRGIKPDFLSAMTYSKYKPLRDGKSEKARSRNRRIEITLLKKKY